MSYNKLRSHFLGRSYKILYRCSHSLWTEARKLDTENYILNHRTREDDIFIVTYPKSGTTWMQAIVWEIVHPGVEFQHILRASPHLEDIVVPNNIDIDKMNSPRIIKSHLSIDKMMKGRGRYIYVVRNAPDVAASFYHHHVQFLSYREGIDKFFSDFFRKKSYGVSGNWFSHVGKWVGDRSLENLLIVRYEDLQLQFDVEIERISKFLKIEVDEKHAANIRDRCSLTYMKENISKFIHVRNGAVGEGGKYMTEALNRSYVRAASRYMHLPIMRDYVRMALDASEENIVDQAVADQTSVSV